MVGNPHRWRAAIPQLENRNATAGCLLAVLFFVPYLGRTCHVNPLLLCTFVIVYVTLIVPIGTGIIPRKYVIGRLRYLLSLVLDESKRSYYLTQLTYIASWIHFIYVQFEGVHVFMMQVMFNVAAEKVLCPEEKLSSLYVLLFYSLLAYIQRSLQSRMWVQLLSEISTKEFIKLTTAFIIVRLGKAVVLSLVLLTITVQFDHLEPSCPFVCLTLTFFLLTQYQNHAGVKKFLIDTLSYLELQCLDGMEENWIPVIIHGASVALSAGLFLALILATNNYLTAITLVYINVFVPSCHSLGIAVQELLTQRRVISRYPLATWKNPQIRGGNPCAVCLDKMRILSARCTPCGHVFHGSCLRRCLQHFSHCPLCKTQIR